MNSARVNSSLSLAKLSLNTFSKCLRFSADSSVRLLKAGPNLPFLLFILSTFSSLPHLGFVMVRTKFIISSTETTPSLSASASRRILAGTPLLDRILWNVSGLMGLSCKGNKGDHSNFASLPFLSSLLGR